MEPSVFLLNFFLRNFLIVKVGKTNSVKSRISSTDTKCLLNEKIPLKLINRILKKSM